ncbi:MAG TPA: STAS domain-containing protein [Jatrophihabitans sp.]|nr:STAS domain-containing protein [Jatrophihabitans sp.]
MASDEAPSSRGPADQPTGPSRTIGSDTRRATIALRGELDLADAPALRAELDGHRNAGRQEIHIDLALVTFIDSTVIGELVSAAERCHTEQGALRLTNVPPRVQQIIQLTGLAPLLLSDTTERTEP